MNLLRTIARSHKQKLAFMAGITTVALSLVIMIGLNTQKVRAADYSNNAIMCGGFSDPTDFINKLRANNDCKGHHDLQSIYHAYGLDTTQYGNFEAHAVAGTAYRDGRIVVNGGPQVASGSRSIGRELGPQGSGAYAQPIAGEIFYGNTSDKAFASDSLPVYMLFDGQGNLIFTVLKDCGNPMSSNVVPTSASCNLLQKVAVPGKQDTYNFTASGNVKGNAKITTYIYSFGDGSTKQMTDGNVPVPHTYTKAGTFSATVTEYASVPGNGALRLPITSGCTKISTVVTPFYSCTSLVPTTVDKSKYIYKFTATTRFGNGAIPTTADFYYGDGTSTKGVNLTATYTYTVSHTYPAAKTYNSSALLHFTVNGKPVTATNACPAMVSPTHAPTPTCKPGIPIGDSRCDVCLTNPSVPANDTQDCTPTVTPPAELPNTGAGNVIAIFGVVVVGSFLVYRQLLFRKHKAAFAAAQNGTSPLPLGQPLDAAPLAGTPLATKKRSLRRRQF